VACFSRVIKALLTMDSALCSKVCLSVDESLSYGKIF
jgi:hypothetical protein